LLYEIARWRIHKESTRDHLEMWREIFDYAKSRSEKFYVTRSRILQLADEESSEEETWGWIDEYEDREAYDKMAKAKDEDPELARMNKQWHSKWDPMRVPDSFKAELWTERVRVDLKKQA
jgi:hypothetical protein